MKKNLVNFAGFQLCWFANILGAAHGLVWLGPLVTLSALAVFLYSNPPLSRSVDIAVVVCAAALGYIADSLLVITGLLEFAPAARLGGPSPLWMVALWMAFAATLRHSLAWLRDRCVTSALLGLLGGPIAYYAGAELGAVVLPRPVESLIAVALVWLVMTPALIQLAKWLESRIGREGSGRESGYLT